MKLVLVLLLMFSISFAQEDASLEETLNNLSASGAKNYLSPIASAFGANLNAGWFHKAPQPKIFGFNLELGLVAMGSQFGSGTKHFRTDGQFNFSQDQARSILESNLQEWNSLPASVQNDFLELMASQSFGVEMEGATIIGKKDDYITVRFPGQTITEPNSGREITVDDQEVVLPVGGFKELADVSLLPMFAPQLTLGTIYGTQATFRYLPQVELEQGMGKFKYFGFGVQHNPAAWLSVPLPLDVSASFFTQSLKIGELFETNTVAFGLNASKQFGLNVINITPYAGFMIESSTMRVTYDYIVQAPSGDIEQKIDFEIDGENTTRFTIGLSIRLLIININADYNIGQYNSLSAGVNFAIN